MSNMSRTASASPAVLGRPVYEAWKEFAFEETISAFQQQFENVIDNAAGVAADKQELVAFVTGMKQRTSGKEMVPAKEVDDSLAFFKKVFQKLLQRAADSEASFSQLFSKVGCLPDPTPMLSTNGALSAKVVQLEAELAALSENHTEAQVAAASSKATQQELSRLRSDLEALDTTARRREEEVESLQAQVSALLSAEAEAGLRHSELEERFMQVAEERSLLQTERDKKADQAAEELNHMGQLLADRSAEIADLRRRCESESGSAVAAEQLRSLELKYLNAESALQTERDAVAALEDQLAAGSAELARRNTELASLKKTLLNDPAADQEKRRQKIQRLVHDLGDLGEACLASLGSAAPPHHSIMEELREACDEQDIVFALRARIRTLASAVRDRQAELARERQRHQEAQANESDLRQRLRESEEKVLTMRARLDAVSHLPLQLDKSGVAVAPVPAEGAKAVPRASEGGSGSAGGGFNLGDLVEEVSAGGGDAGAEGEVRISMPAEGGVVGDGGAVAQLLMTQRDSLNERVAELEGEKARLTRDAQAMQRRIASLEDAVPQHSRHIAAASPSPPVRKLGQGVGGGGGGPLSALDAMAAKTLGLLGHNIYTRRFAVCYVTLLHLLVSGVLWHVSFTSHTAKQRHSF